MFIILIIENMVEENRSIIIEKSKWLEMIKRI